ncbi:MAG: hypothetical protein WBX17_01055, partial [Microbacterium sp.]
TTPTTPTTPADPTEPTGKADPTQPADPAASRTPVSSSNAAAPAAPGVLGGGTPDAAALAVTGQNPLLITALIAAGVLVLAVGAALIIFTRRRTPMSD